MEQNILVRIGADITNFTSNIGKANRELDAFRQANKDTFDAFKQVGTAITIAGLATAGALGYTVKEAGNFQSHFAGVRKVVDASEAEFAALEQGIRDMAKELPASATDIADVAAAAGQLGIETPNILDFTRTMIDLGESSNLTAEEAAVSFARFANITKMPQSEVDKLGSTVVNLGNNLATTEAEIVNMSMRLAAQGTQVGMSQDQIMGLAGAMSSVGVEAEAGGTAMTMVLKKMQADVSNGGKGLKKWADIAGMSAGDFKKAFEKDAAGALDAVVKGLGKASEEGGNMAAILEDVGVKGIRESDTMMRLAGAGDVLTNSLQYANQGWTENTALTNEASERYKTFESKLAILKNTFKDVAISVGNVLLPTVTAIVDKITEFVRWIGDLNPKILTAAAIFASVAAAVMLIAGPLLLLIGFIPQIIAGFTAVKTVFTAVRAAMMVLAGPIPIIIALVVGLAYLIYKYWDEIKAYTITAWGAIKEFFTNLWTSIKDTAVSIWEGIKAFFSGLGSYFANLWTSIKETAVNIWNSIVDGLANLWASIVGIAQSTWQMVVNTVIAIITPFVTAFLTVWNGMKSGLETVWNGISTYFSGVWDLIKNIVLGAVLLLINLVTGNFSELGKNAKAIWDNIKESIATILSGLAQIFIGIWETISGGASAAWDLIKGTILNGLTEAEAFVLEKMNMVQDILYAAWTFIRGIFENALTAIFGDTGTAFDQIQNKIQVAMDQAWMLIETVWLYIKDTFLNTLAFLKALVTGDFGAMKRIISDQIKLAKETVKYILSDIKVIFTNILTAVVFGVKAKFDQIKSAISDKIATAANILKFKWEKMKRDTVNILANIVRTGREKFENLKSAIREKLDNTVETIKSIWDNVMNFFRNIDLKQIGKDIIEGLIKGITSKVKAVADAVKNVTDTITGKIKGILGIASPSKVTTQFGRWTGEGLANGIEAERNNVARAAESLTEAASANITPSLDYRASTSGLSAALNGSVGIRDERDSALLRTLDGLRRDLTNLRVEMDGQTVGRITAPTVGRELSGQTASTIRGKGRRRI